MCVFGKSQSFQLKAKVVSDSCTPWLATQSNCCLVYNYGPLFPDFLVNLIFSSCLIDVTELYNGSFSHSKPTRIANFKTVVAFVQFSFFNRTMFKDSL